MRVAVFFDQYLPFHETKDPGQIPLGLIDLGISASVITLEKKEFLDYSSPLPIIQIRSLDEIRDILQAFNVVIVYSWLQPSYNRVIREIKEKGKTVIIKSDSDGRVGVTIEPKNRRVEYYIKHKLLSRASLGYIKRLLINSLEFSDSRKKIEQIELADFIVIESPDAANNLSFFLAENGRVDLISKIHVIPNPVTPDIINSDIDSKENIVTSIGRWDDVGPKNPKGLIEVLAKFLYFKANWRATIIGPGEKVIKQHLNMVPTSIQNRINITGPIPHEEIKKHLIRSKIFFMPSRWEGFSIAAAEAVCCGCTVVGSPLESLRYLTMQGFSGNVSYSLDNNALLGTLLYEAGRWEAHEVDYVNIAHYWRNKLNRQSIAKQFVKLIQRTQN